VRTRALRLAVTLVVVALAAPAAAVADTDVAIDEDTLFVSSDDATLFSAVTFNPVPNKYTVDDDNGDVNAGGGCVQQAASPPTFPHKYATCANNGIFHLVGSLGGGNDLLQVQATIQLDVVAIGEDGNDSIFGALEDDLLVGSAGDDQLYGNGGDDEFDDGLPEFGGAGGDDSFAGGSGDDTLQGGRFDFAVDQGSGADVLSGGAGGTDTVDYSKRKQPLTLTDDGQPNDGQKVGGASEGDNVTSVEIVLGGEAGDRITGGPESNELRGNGGPDVLDGGEGGADILTGGPGTDWTTYAARTKPVVVTLDQLANDGRFAEGDDAETENVEGGADADSLTGSSGANVLRGGAGGDQLRGLGGDDTIEAKDGVRDTVSCGTGVDAATVDPIDSVAADCEKVTGKPKPGKPRLKVGKKALLAEGRLRVKVSAGAVCSGGSLVVRSVGNRVGSRAFSLPAAGKQRAIKVRVGSALKGRKRARVRATCPGLVAAARKVRIRRP
jgi:Ca2+-binding RTX toxin-like protein